MFSKDKVFDLDKESKEFGKFAVLIFLVWIFFFFIVPTKWADGNELGDNFGIFNTLFSGLAFAALVYTLNLQIRDFRAQHESNAELKALQERTAKALEATAVMQNDILKIQEQIATFQQETAICMKGFVDEQKKTVDELRKAWLIQERISETDKLTAMAAHRNSKITALNTLYNSYSGEYFHAIDGKNTEHPAEYYGKKRRLIFNKLEKYVEENIKV